MTVLPQGVLDVDGNVYGTTTIGTQVWMTEDLKTKKYKDGTGISYPGPDNIVWQNNTTGAYSWYNNNESIYKNPYGALYNWYAVNTGKLCPVGWHVPTDPEWTILTTYLGGEGIAGGKLKETGFIHWLSPNTGATNICGFNGLPGGYRNFDGIYHDIGFSSNYWSSTETNINQAWHRSLMSEADDIARYYYSKNDGFSVRCIKD
ncbi:MAG: hypothetical protein E4G94_06035 [ANME-2 cluster archaeon]|nr:MAG: hypothetical protein E4G94_06035 [ANME-2 cluster archaeon]